MYEQLRFLSILICISFYVRPPGGGPGHQHSVWAKQIYDFLMVSCFFSCSQKDIIEEKTMKNKLGLMLSTTVVCLCVLGIGGCTGHDIPYSHHTTWKGCHRSLHIILVDLVEISYFQFNVKLKNLIQSVCSYKVLCKQFSLVFEYTH